MLDCWESLDSMGEVGDAAHMLGVNLQQCSFVIEGGSAEWRLSEAIPEIVESSAGDVGVRGHSLSALLGVLAHMSIAFVAIDAMFGNVSFGDGSDPWTSLHFGCLTLFHVELMYNLASYGRAMYVLGDASLLVHMCTPAGDTHCCSGCLSMIFCPAFCTPCNVCASTALAGNMPTSQSYTTRQFCRFCFQRMCACFCWRGE